MDINELELDENDIKKDAFVYKGYFIENDEAEEEPKYYEFGAHFQYKELYNVLFVLRQKQLKMEKGKKIEKIFQSNKKKVINRERNNTRNKDNEKENNYNQIINIFKFKGKTRNIDNEEQDDLTFIPKNNFNNYSSLKKGPQNRTTNNYKSQFNPGRINYLKIYKNKIDNIKKNETQFEKYSENYLSNKKKQKCFVNQRMNIFKTKNIKENNKNEQFLNDISLHKSFQNNQIHQIKKKVKKNIKINFFPQFSNSKSIIEKGNIGFKNDLIKSSRITTNRSELNRIRFMGEKEMIKLKTLNNILNCHNSKSKINKNITEYKNIKGTIEAKEEKKIPIKNHVSIIKLDNNNSSTSDNIKPIISASIDYNNLKLFNNDKIGTKNKLVKRQINEIKNISNLNNDFNNKNKLGIKNEKSKGKFESVKNQESLNVLFNNKEKISRNKINDLMKNMSLINFTENKSIFRHLSKINSSQQYISFLKRRGQNKNRKNLISNISYKNKYSIVGMASFSNSNRKNNHPSRIYNNISANNYYSTGIITEKLQNKKINNTYMNSMALNDSHKIVSIKRIKLNKKFKKDLNKKYALKNIILKSNSRLEKINKENKNMKKNTAKSELLNDKKRYSNKGRTKEQKYQNLTTSNDNNKNINININISNNNSNIIYNNNFSNISKNKKCSRTNTQKSFNTLNKKKNINMKNNINSGNLEFKIKKTIQYKNNNKNDNTKVKLINIKFPKAKFLNIFK